MTWLGLYKQGIGSTLESTKLHPLGYRSQHRSSRHGLTETLVLRVEGTGTLKLKLGVRAVGTSELDLEEAVEGLPPRRISLILFLSSAVRLALPFAAKKLAS